MYTDIKVDRQNPSQKTHSVIQCIEIDVIIFKKIFPTNDATSCPFPGQRCEYLIYTVFVLSIYGELFFSLRERHPHGEIKTSTVYCTQSQITLQHSAVIKERLRLHGNTASAWNKVVEKCWWLAGPGICHRQSYTEDKSKKKKKKSESPVTGTVTVKSPGLLTPWGRLSYASRLVQVEFFFQALHFQWILQPSFTST